MAAGLTLSCMIRLVLVYMHCCPQTGTVAKMLMRFQVSRTLHTAEPVAVTHHPLLAVSLGTDRSFLLPFTNLNSCITPWNKQVWRKTRTGRKKMSVKWLKELDKEYTSLADTARRLNSEDGFVMMHKASSRRRSDHHGDGEDGGGKSTRKNKHGKRKGGGSDDSGSVGSGEEGGDSGSGGSSSKRGRKHMSDASREGSLTPPTHNDSVR